MFEWQKVEKMIVGLHAFPECQVEIDKNRTSLHIAALSGNWKKLKVLVRDMNNRYMLHKNVKA